MRSCGRSDAEARNQAGEISRMRVRDRTLLGAAHYNRLDIWPPIHHIPVTGHSSRASVSVAFNPKGCRERRAPGKAPASRVFLSLVEERKSCHKQGRGVARFPRGSSL
jgi:hypothetical protein